MVPYIKICGLTRVADILFAAESGADALGFIAHPPSRRHLSPAKLETLLKEAKLPSSKTKVLVFTGADASGLSDYLNTGIDAVQFHSTSPPSPEDCLPPSIRAWRALRCPDEKSLLSQLAFPAEIFVFDTYTDGMIGGTGRKSDWDLASLAVKSSRKPVLLAGGIAESDIIPAMRSVSPYGFDVNSSLEDSPGIKNQDKIKSFFDFIRREF